jgi:hypothetical protein
MWDWESELKVEEDPSTSQIAEVWEDKDKISDTKEDDTAQTLESIQKKLLYMRIEHVLWPKLTSGTASFFDENIIEEITDQIREDGHNQPSGWWDGLMKKIGTDITAMMHARMLNISQAQAKQYYKLLLEDLKKIQSIKSETQQNLEQLYNTVFDKWTSQTTTSSTSTQNTSDASSWTTDTKQEDVSPAQFWQKPSTQDVSPPQPWGDNTIVPRSAVVVATQIQDKKENPTPSPPTSTNTGKQTWDRMSDSILESAKIFRPRIKNTTDWKKWNHADWRVKDSNIRYQKLHQNLRAFYVDMNEKFPWLCITSCNDGSHAKWSRHYTDTAIDIGGWSSDPKAYRQFVQYLSSNLSHVKQQYNIEDIIWLKGEKGHSNHIHVELPKLAQKSNTYD